MNNERTRIGIRRQVDKLGRIVIPKEYRDFFHIDCEDEVFIVDTSEGLLITNPKYKVVRAEDEEYN